HVGDRLAAHARLEHLGPEALAVAVRAAQVHVGKKLHLHVLEAVAAAGRAAAVARVEAERAGRIAALAARVASGVDAADRVPGADVARRVGARRLADRRLVDHDDLADLVRALERAVRARRLGRPALGLLPGGVAHVLDQRPLARAGDAGHAHQTLERKAGVDALQVVLGRAFEREENPRGERLSLLRRLPPP